MSDFPRISDQVRVPEHLNIEESDQTNDSTIISKDPGELNDTLENSSAVNPFSSTVDSATTGEAERAALPDAFVPGFDPISGLQEKVDIPTNLPAGNAINSGLAGLDADFGKTGPDHMGVDLAAAGFKSDDVIADVLGTDQHSAYKSSLGTGGFANTRPGSSLYAEGEDAGSTDLAKDVHDGTSTVPDVHDDNPGNAYVDGQSKSAADVAKDAMKGAADSAKDVVNTVVDTAYKVVDTLMKGVEYVDMLWDAAVAPVVVEEVTGDPRDLGHGFKAALQTDRDDAVMKKINEGNMVNPDSDLGGLPDDEEIARKAGIFFGSNADGLNPADGFGGVPITPEDIKEGPFAPVADPSEEGATNLGTISAEQIKLAGDIKGPDTLNPNSGFGSGPIQPGDVKGGADPSDQENFS